MNRPTPDPSQEGSRHRSASCQFPSWEGLGVGSWSQCMRESERGLSMNLRELREFLEKAIQCAARSKDVRISSSVRPAPNSSISLILAL